jgi:hypothetical protein
MNGHTIITRHPMTVSLRRPTRSERCPNSGIVHIETSACTTTKLRSVARGNFRVCVP